MTVSLGTAYRSFGGEVEASNTPTICRLHRFMPSPTLGHSSPDQAARSCLEVIAREPDVVRRALAARGTAAARSQTLLKKRVLGKVGVVIRAGSSSAADMSEETLAGIIG
jgi:hypothetical protein